MRWRQADEHGLYTCTLPAALHPGTKPAVHGFRRAGVHAGNYAEEILAADARGRPGFLLDKGGCFAASTTTREAFTADGKAGEALAANARRDDIFREWARGGAQAAEVHVATRNVAGHFRCLACGAKRASVLQVHCALVHHCPHALAAVKYVKYGRSQVMGEDRSGFWASTTQLAYGRAGQELWVGQAQGTQRASLGALAQLCGLPHGCQACCRLACAQLLTSGTPCFLTPLSMRRRRRSGGGAQRRKQPGERRALPRAGLPLGRRQGSQPARASDCTGLQRQH